MTGDDHDSFSPAQGTPPAEVVLGGAHAFRDRLGGNWKVRRSPVSLVRISGTGLRHTVVLQSNRYNRTDQSVEIFAMVNIRSKRLAAWRKDNPAAVVDVIPVPGGPRDVVCENGLGYTFGTWSDGVFNLLRPGHPQACWHALQRHAVPWFESADVPLNFVRDSPRAVRSMNAHSLIEWLLSLGERSAAGDFAGRFVAELEHVPARDAFARDVRWQRSTEALTTSAATGPRPSAGSSGAMTSAGQAESQRNRPTEAPFCVAAPGSVSPDPPLRLDRWRPAERANPSYLGR